MNIRKAVPDDIPVIVDFQQKMAYETEQITLDDSVLSSGVKNVFSDHSLGFYLIVENENKIIASMLLTPEWSDWRNSLFLWIQSLYVLPDFRKKGVFKLLYNYVKTMVSQSDKYSGIKLYVDQDNKKAQEAYSKVGMEASHYHLYEWNKSNY